MFAQTPLVVVVDDDEVVGVEDVTKVGEFSGFIIEGVEVVYRSRRCHQSWGVQWLHHWSNGGS